ncbi:tetratricopeptide repeat-containing sensor histidine kinase [Flavobacterium pedocola]
MVRSPFLILVIFSFLFSCKNDFKGESDSGVNRAKANLSREEAIVKFGESKFDSAFFFFHKAKELYEIEKDTLNIGYCLYQMARAQQTIGDYYGSEETLTELLKFKIPDYIAPAYNQLGIIAKEQKNYDDAYKNYSWTLENAKNEVEKISPLNNMAVIWIQKSEPLKAVDILESILKSKVFRDTTLNAKKARVVDNLGYAYFKVNRNKDALTFLNEGLEIRNKDSLSYDAIESFLHLAEFYQNSNIAKSDEYALKAYENATNHKSIDERLESLSFLMANNIRQGKNQYVSQFLRLNDSIVKVRNNAKNQFAKIKYDSQIEKEENQKLKFERADNLLKLERAKTQSLLLVIGFVTLVFLVFWIVRFFVKRNRKEKQKAIHETEARISKQLHDELANDVYQTISYVQVQEFQNSQRKETLLRSLDGIYKKARDISRGIAEIDTDVQYKSNLKQMISDYANDEIKVIIKDNHDINWDKVETGKKVAVYRALQELMVNMKKHSHASFVVVGFEDVGNVIQIKYSDNGVGISEQLNLKNGLTNAENRINAIKGTITFETDTNKGLRVNLSIPK